MKTSHTSQSLSAKGIYDNFYNRASKKFGQNFLFDEKINRKIVSLAGDLSEKTVVEIGPGPGGLTLEILRQNVRKLHIIEYDRHWSSVWKSLQKEYFPALEILEADALEFDLKSLAPDVLISNLPYNISTQLLFKWLPELDLCQKFILMFQKEVADRIYASHGTKSYGKLSILAQLKSIVSKCFDLEPGSFFPAPKVKSTVLKFTPIHKEKCIAMDKYRKLSEFLSSAFIHRRKTVIKSMHEFFDNPQTVLEELGYDKNARAEQISVPDYKKMAEKYM